MAHQARRAHDEVRDGTRKKGDLVIGERESYSAGACY